MGDIFSDSSDTQQQTSTRNQTTRGYENVGTVFSEIGGRVNVEVSDQGAIQASENIARDAIGSSERNLDVVAGTLERGQQGSYDFASDTVRESFAHADEALASSERTTQESIDAVGQAYSGATDAVTEASRDALRAADDSQSQAYGFAERNLEAMEDSSARVSSLASDYADNLRSAYEGVGEYVSRTGQEFMGAVERFQARESSNTDARLEEVTTTALWVGGAIAVGAVVLVVWGR